MPFLPTTWEVSAAIAAWKTDESLSLPLTSELSVIHGSLTLDKSARLEVVPRIAMMNRRTFGFVVDITAPTDVPPFCEPTVKNFRKERCKRILKPPNTENKRGRIKDYPTLLF